MFYKYGKWVLTIEAMILVFKSLVLSQAMHLALIMTVPIFARTVGY